MNYRHSFHAGNFADCVKHIVLLELLRALTEKETPINYFETHAGRGRYALDTLETEQAEWQNGIGKLLGITGLSPEIHRYVERVKSVNSGEFAVYPGSPLLAAARLRNQDRLELCELEATQVQALSELFARDARVRTFAKDGYQQLKAALPLVFKRGLVLIDPPFERHDEFAQIATALNDALTRWATGVYAVWYPIKNGRELAPFHRALIALPAKNLLLAEFCVHPDVSDLRLNGCGMAIVNAPYRFEQVLERVLKPLHRLLRVEARSRVGWRWLRAPQ
jgi:23S rRNA (adenine2030-N6)-methyltransferase